MKTLSFFLLLLPGIILGQRPTRDTVTFVLQDSSPVKRIARCLHYQKKLYLLANWRCVAYGTSADNLITPYRYDAGRVFKNGYAIVTRDRLKGIIDSTGKEIIPPKYHTLSNITEGMFFFSRSGNRLDGLVDLKGKEYLLPKSIDSHTWTSFSMVYNEPLGDSLFLSIMTDYLPIPYHFSESLAVIDHKIVINKKGECIFILYNGEEAPGDYREGLLRISKNQGWSLKTYGFVDRTGKTVISPVYHSATDFVNGISIVTTGDIKAPVEKKIDKQGKIID